MPKPLSTTGSAARRWREIEQLHSQPFSVKQAFWQTLVARAGDVDVDPLWWFLFSAGPADVEAALRAVEARKGGSQ